MSDAKTVLTEEQVAQEQLVAWSYDGTDPASLSATFETGDFATGLRLVNSIGELAEAANHHPDVDLRYGHVDVRLSSHDAGGVTARDVKMARSISERAAAEKVVPRER
jgi:4a-hydroxytetrahydrobiopterin dehydratase